MHTHQLAHAEEQLSLNPLFQCLYVKQGRATYAVSKAHDFNEVIWYRTVDLRTGFIHDENANLDLLTRVREDQPCFDLIRLMQEHFSAEYILSDAFALIDEQLRTKDRDHMHRHTVFGQSLFYSDIEELNAKED